MRKHTRPPCDSGLEFTTHFRPGGRLSVSQSPKFLSLIARTRAAVLSGPVQTQDEKGGHILPAPQHEQARDASPAPSPVPLKVPRHVHRHEQAAPVPRVLAKMPTAETLRAGVPYLTPSAVKVHTLLVQLAADVMRARGFEALPDAITFHNTAVGVALHLNLSERTVYRAADELTAAGILAHGGHAQNVRGRSLYDGTVFKVSLKPGHVPKIRADEWRVAYRPQFTDDYVNKTGVRAVLSELKDLRTGEQGYRILLSGAVAVVHAQNPRCSSVLTEPVKRAVKGLDDVAALVRGIAHVHHTRRSEAVTEASQALAYALSEPHRRAQWAGLLWNAVRAEWEGRAGLEHVALNLLRLRTDLTEGAPWAKPGAVLTARLT